LLWIEKKKDEKKKKKKKKEEKTIFGLGTFGGTRVSGGVMGPSLA